jgi:hypothetical protein
MITTMTAPQVVHNMLLLAIENVHLYLS